MSPSGQDNRGKDKFKALTCDTNRTNNSSFGLDSTNEGVAIVTEFESPKQSTDSEHHDIDNEGRGSRDQSTSRIGVDESFSRREVAASNPNEQRELPKIPRVRDEKNKPKRGRIDFLGKEPKYDTERRSSRQSAKMSSNFAGAGWEVVDEFPAKYYTMRHISTSKSHNDIPKPSRGSKTEQQGLAKSSTLTSKSQRYKESAHLAVSCKSTSPEKHVDSCSPTELTKALLKFKTRSDSSTKRQHRSRSIGAQSNIYAHIDEVITTDEESSPANHSSRKSQQRSERRKHLSEMQQESLRNRKQKQYQALKPQLESVNEEKVLTLTKKQQSRLKARMIDGFVTVNQLMTHGVSSNPLVSVTTL